MSALRRRFRCVSTYAAPGMPSAKAPLWRRLMRSPTLRTWVLYVPICCVSSAMAASTWEARHGGSATGAMSGASVGVWLLGLGVAASLAYRRRYPVVVCLIACVATIITPLDPVAALIAFGSLTVRRVDRVTAGVAIPVAVATFISNYRDGQGLSSAESVWQMMRGSGAPVGPDGRTPIVHYLPLPLWSVAVITAALMAVAFGLAMLIRDRSKDRARKQADVTQQLKVDSLQDQIDRQAERERIATEIHDALGHRLSMVSMQASVLELKAADLDPEVVATATIVRANANKSMDDLKTLINTLHRPDSPDIAAAVPTLREVSALIDETAATGPQLISTVQLERIEHLDGQTSRSAYRLTQELLTNARRHAPGIGIRVSVIATPHSGVIIEVANHLAPEAPEEIAPGNGLRGAQTRVDQLGGEWHCWVDHQRVFRVAIRLPWLSSGTEPANPPPPPPSGAQPLPANQLSPQFATGQERPV